MKWKILTKKTRLVPLISAPFHSISPTMIRFLHWKLISLSASRWGEGVKTYRQKNGRADRPTDRELYIQIDRQTFIYMQVKINSQCGKQTGLHWYFKKKVWHYGPVAQWTRGTMDLWHYGLFPFGSHQHFPQRSYPMPVNWLLGPSTIKIKKWQFTK